MKLVATGLVLVAFTGCKNKESPPAGANEGTGSAPAAPDQASRPSQGTLPQLPALEQPDDPKRAQKVALGHVLFFDKRLSGASDRSCYSCHQNEHGNGGKDPL